jgi:hypothetical protein
MKEDELINLTRECTQHIDDKSQQIMLQEVEYKDLENRFYNLKMTLFKFQKKDVIQTKFIREVSDFLVKFQKVQEGELSLQECIFDFNTLQSTPLNVKKLTYIIDSLSEMEEHQSIPTSSTKKKDLKSEEKSFSEEKDSSNSTGADMIPEDVQTISITAQVNSISIAEAIKETPMFRRKTDKQIQNTLKSSAKKAFSAPSSSDKGIQNTISPKKAKEESVLKKADKWRDKTSYPECTQTPFGVNLTPSMKAKSKEVKRKIFTVVGNKTQGNPAKKSQLRRISEGLDKSIKIKDAVREYDGENKENEEEKREEGDKDGKFSFGKKRLDQIKQDLFASKLKHDKEGVCTKKKGTTCGVNTHTQIQTQT